MDFPKKQAQRLMPLYLLEYSEKLFTNHPNPEDPWGGGGGSDYTAGQGITITNNEISVDTNVIAAKSDIPTKTSELTNDSGFITGSSISNFAEIVDVTNGFPDATKTAEILANPSKYIMHGTITIKNFAYHIFASYAGNVTTNGHTWMQIIRIPYNGYYTLKPYAFCYDDDNTWKGPYQYLWKISYYDDIYNAPKFATVATSGNYEDLINKPTIPDTSNLVTLDTEQTITGLKTIGETSGTTSEVDFSGFTFKLSNKAINHPEADIKIRNASYDGYQYPTIYSTKGLYVNLAKIKLGDDGNNRYGITMPDSSTWEADRVLATTNDIPSLDGYATQTWVQEQGYATSSSLATVATTGSYNDLIDKPNLLPIRNAWEEFTFTETGTHVPPYKWGENMACTSTWICYGSVEALPQIYLKNWFSLHECYAYPQYMWQDSDGYHAVYSTELVQDNTGASGARIVLNAPSLGVTWTSVSTYPEYGKDKVNNATITFTQGGVNKGSFTVNQLNNQTIALDAPGSTYIAGNGINITNDTISVDDTVALKSEVPSTATSTSTSTVTPSTIELVFTYEDNTTQTITLMTDATVSTSTTTTLS